MIFADWESAVWNRFYDLGLDEQKEYKDRLSEEMKVVKAQANDYKKDPVSYFNDMVKHSEENGPIENSNNMLLSYVLGITEDDPIKSGVKLVKTKSAEFPDIDMDFEDAQRDLAKEYLIEKYGRENVASICAMGTMKAKAVIKDIGRVKGIDHEEINEVTKTMGYNDKLEDAAVDNDVVKEFFWKYDDMDMYNLCIKLQGNIRHMSQHAAGVIIAPGEITKYCGLEKANSKITTCWGESGGNAELGKVGLIKFDLLGLNTLTVMKDALNMIKVNHDKDIDIDNIDLNDKFVLQGFFDAKTVGIFQFERDWIRNQLKKIRITTFADVAAVNALNRPGPLGAGMDEKFYKTKNKIIAPSYLHPALEPFLKETYCVILYQEQVMKISQALAGFTEEEADNFRKIASKGKDMLAKGINPFEKWEKRFINGCKKKGVVGRVKVSRTITDDSQIPVTAENVQVVENITDAKGVVKKKITCTVEVSDELFNQIKEFAGYGFNKSHAVAYAMISMQGMFLKRYYPSEFMASILSNTPNAINQAEKTNKFVDYFFEAKAMGIKVLPPDINKSEVKFKAQKDSSIISGFGFIKNLGVKAIDEIIEKRPFKSFGDFLIKVNGRSVNKSSVFSLVHSGAFDQFLEIDGNRNNLIKRYDLLREYVGYKKKKDLDIPINPSAIDAILEEGEFCGDQIYNSLLDLVDVKSINSKLGVDDKIVDLSYLDKIDVKSEVRVVGLVKSFFIKNYPGGKKIAFMNVKNGPKTYRVMFWNTETQKIHQDPKLMQTFRTKNVIAFKVKRDRDYKGGKTFIGVIDNPMNLIYQ